MLGGRNGKTKPTNMALTTNLVAWYKLDSGALTTDATGNGNTLTNNNSVAGGTAFLGTGSASYNSTSGQRLISSTALNMTASSNNTISCWVKFTANGYVWDWVTTSGGNRCFTLYTDATANKLRVYTWGNDFEPSTTITINNWNHVVVTKTSGGTIEMFINGTSVGTVALGGSGQGSGNALSIGCQWGSSSSITGSVDEVGVWDRVLTGAEITSLYNAGAGVTYPFATAYTKSVPESITISDTNSNVRGYAKAIVEAITIGELLIRAATKRVVESITSTDVVAGVKVQVYSFTESVTVSDTYSYVKGYGALILEAITVADAKTIAAVRAIIESVTIGEAVLVSRLYLQSVASSITVTDSLITTSIRGYRVLESITLHEVPAAAKNGFNISLRFFKKYTAKVASFIKKYPLHP
jgi:hypothetical protein